ncbi:hypothetical protein F511_29621 [Dorcoceras hygrometricum]|uniref:Zinc finger BED domain-containing protein RICESLEEPER 2-like n=1 Tax=Dorcoceras hygrometricum TaxID=472368 RepID=A0A2Z7C028_9LAMI|nr:hypothetical protein F511_29621 [Dorcoceras hygrometricum]
MPPPHSGVELVAKLFEFLKEWGIEKKVFSLTLDNASSNDNMQDILKEQLSLHNSLLCDGEFFHIRCSAHILNLIVQEGLKVATASLNKIRESVKYVKDSESRMKKFEECVVAIGGIDTSISLRLDVSIRWNSTYLMLESAIKYKKEGEKICEFLEPFYDTTNLISGSSYPTSNMYFMQVWKIDVLLKENLFNEDVVVGDMCKMMKEKLDKYWSQYSTVLAFGTILDPRIKLSMFFEFFPLLIDPLKCQEKMSLVKRKLYKLFEQYTSQTITNAGKSYLDLYLEEPKLEFAYYEDLDVLGYWMSNKHRYPTLAVTCDVLAIHITTVASESTFSIGARVLTKYRSCTLPENVQALICTRLVTWLCEW